MTTENSTTDIQKEAPVNPVPQKMILSHSESIDKIAGALAKAQGAIKGAKKESANTFYAGSKYADLESVWDAIREHLASNDIAIVQNGGALSLKSENWVEVHTMMIHSSGQWFKAFCGIKVTKFDAHGIGSAITYGRRYSLQSLTGVAPTDDDGNGAMGDKSTGPTPPQPTATQPARKEAVKTAAKAAATTKAPSERDKDYNDILGSMKTDNIAEADLVRVVTERIPEVNEKAKKLEEFTDLDFKKIKKFWVKIVEEIRNPTQDEEGEEGDEAAE